MKHPNFSFLHFLLVSFLLLASNFLFAADTDSSKTWDTFLRTFKTEKLSLTFVKPEIGKSIVSQLEVIDIRPDSSHVGMFANSFSNPVKIVFADGSTLSQVMQNKLSDINNEGRTLLMIVKDFWMINTKPTIGSDTSDKRHPKLNMSKLVMNVDLFLKDNEQYYPLVRIDTTFGDNRPITTSSRTMLEKALEEIYMKLKNSYNQQDYLKRPKANKNAILDNYLKRNAAFQFNKLPLKKGLFLSFDRFKQKEIVETNLLISQNKDGTATLFVENDQGNQVLERKAWGAYDGKDLYILDNGLLFKLYTNGSAWYWIGLKVYEERAYVAPAAVPLGGGWTAVGLERIAGAVRIKLAPKLLNLNTGKEY